MPVMKIGKGLGKAALGIASSATTAAGDIASITADLWNGEPIKRADVRSLMDAGHNISEIASIFGIAGHVLEEFMESDQEKLTVDPDDLLPPTKGERP
jgi:hypothetical protein